MPDITVTTDNDGVATFTLNNGGAQQWARSAPFDWIPTLFHTAFRADFRVAEYIVDQARHEGMNVQVNA